MIIKRILPKYVAFEKLEVGECFVLTDNADASVFLKVHSNNSRKML